MKQGKVYILGAGPGNWELLSLKGKRILEESDCIVYDRLIDMKILDFAKKGAELIYLGKENTEGGLLQEEINQTLVQKCKEGKIVARVKGGDPFVFGRGGEEILALVQENLNFEVIPGITSSIAVPAYAGIPVTHRDMARSFHVFTGHTMQDGAWHDFSVLAKLPGTLIFLMGVKNLDKIVQGLVENGKEKETPVAIIEQGASANQRLTKGTLESIVALAKEREVKSPAITIIGEVVSLQESFDWFHPEKQNNKKVLITRDAVQAKEMAKKITAFGGNSIECPFIAIEELAIPKLAWKEYSVLLFNSPNGVRSFFQNIEDIRSISHLKIGVVGEKTKEVLLEYKMKPDFMPKEYRMDRLVEESLVFSKEGDKILILSSDISPCDSESYTKKYHRHFEQCICYRTIPKTVEISQLKKALKHADYITFLSSSAVEAFARSLGENKDLLEDKKIVSIGPVTSKTLKDLGFSVDIEAKKYSVDGVLESIFVESEE